MLIKRQPMRLLREEKSLLRISFAINVKTVFSYIQTQAKYWMNLHINLLNAFKTVLQHQVDIQMIYILENAMIVDHHAQSAMLNMDAQAVERILVIFSTQILQLCLQDSRNVKVIITLFNM
jgi:hypothetical protein